MGHMKALLPWLLAIIHIVAPSLASGADAGSCYAIADADARAYCRAVAHEDSSICYAIQSPDLRSRCLAEVRK